jgi:hypothetical protein
MGGMSLMPSESYSFPDNFRAALVRLKPVKEPISPPRPAPPAPVKPKIETQAVLPPPPKVSVVPRAKLQSLCKVPPVESSPKPEESGPTTEPLPPVNGSKEVMIPTVAESANVPNPRRGRTPPFPPDLLPFSANPYPENMPVGPSSEGRTKLRRFLICEALALSVLICLALLAISQRFTEQSIALLINVLIIATGAALAIIPMLFYGLGETLPQRDDDGGAPQEREA